METPEILTATKAEKKEILSTIVLAFDADPFTRWLYGNPHRYLSDVYGFGEAFVEEAFGLDTVFYLDGFKGAALWLPPDVHPDEDQLGAIIQDTVPETIHQDLFAVLEQMDSYHPTESHWYLPIIGVDPFYQRKGLGSLLMAHALSRIDKEKKLSYLDATNPLSIPLYQRHGFELLGEIQIGSSPTVYPMLREPR